MAKEVKAEVRKGERPGVPAIVEQTHAGTVYTPAVDIFESDDAITVLADMPGVKAQDLKIDLREDVLTLSGRVMPDASTATEVLREYESGTFFRQFVLAESIDQAKIDAKLADGVLRLELAKVERAKPRQITIKTS